MNLMNNKDKADKIKKIKIFMKIKDHLQLLEVLILMIFQVM